MKLENLGSLITYNDNGTERCLGYLFDFTGHGVFDPTLGKVDISPEHVKAHNAALDEALIKGLDENCGIGQRGTFYLSGFKIKTFCGTEVSNVVVINGNSITFVRAGKKYRGRLQKNSDCFNFKRVS